MLTKETIVALLEEKQPYLAAEFGVSKIGVFGSFATGQPDEASDLDVLVEFDRPIGFRFFELADYLENLLGRKVDILTPAGIQSIRSKKVAKSITENVVYGRSKALANIRRHRRPLPRNAPDSVKMLRQIRREN